LTLISKEFFLFYPNFLRIFYAKKNFLLLRYYFEIRKRAKRFQYVKNRKEIIQIFNEILDTNYKMIKSSSALQINHTKNIENTILVNNNKKIIIKKEGKNR